MKTSDSEGPSILADYFQGPRLVTFTQAANVHWPVTRPLLEMEGGNRQTPEPVVPHHLNPQGPQPSELTASVPVNVLHNRPLQPPFNLPIFSKRQMGIVAEPRPNNER